MSAVADPRTTSGRNNQPGSGTCPHWLLLLDEPAPPRVLLVGSAAPATVAWFAERGADVHREDAVPGIRSDAAFDLVVVEDPHGAVSPARSDLVDLSRCCSPDGELRLPWRPTPSLREALAAAGFPSVRAEADAGPRRRPGAGHGLVAGRRPAGGPPAWLTDVVRQAGLPAVGAGWSLEVPDSYPSRKAIARVPGSQPGDDLVVKLTRHPRFNGRLDNEAHHLAAAAMLEPAVTAAMPTVVGRSSLAGLTTVVESALPGRPFLDVARLGPSCPLGRSVATWTTRLAVASAQPLDGADLADRLLGLLTRFEHRFRPTPASARFLREQVDLIARADDLPGVLVHGDLGTWNLLAHQGAVGVLDWESAEWPGPPLWDLWYFVRSFAVRSGRRRGLRRDRALRRHLTEGSRLNDVAAGWVRTYADAVGVDRDLVAPLFHTCWMHRAVKESTRLPADASGHYGPLCLRLVDARHAPGVRALVGLERTG